MWCISIDNFGLEFELKFRIHDMQRTKIKEYRKDLIVETEKLYS